MTVDVDALSVGHRNEVDAADGCFVGVEELNGEAVIANVGAGSFVLLVLLDVGAAVAGDVALVEAGEGGGAEGEDGGEEEGG